MAERVRPYRRLSFAEKAKRAKEATPVRSRYRCGRCGVTVEDRDRASHLERCWAEILMQCFMRVD